MRFLDCCAGNAALAMHCYCPEVTWQQWNRTRMMKEAQTLETTVGDGLHVRRGGGLVKELWFWRTAAGPECAALRKALTRLTGPAAGKTR